MPFQSVVYTLAETDENARPYTRGLILVLLGFGRLALICTLTFADNHKRVFFGCTEARFAWGKGFAVFGRISRLDSTHSLSLGCGEVVCSACGEGINRKMRK
ncbi:hypothetical protein RHMOL_Rhmol05G0022800 [Rhododendron molle]|uniref:Uncharacterized protein n=1 Tax=Rhododendron molle TaxID=49168 RepID=A0ACC0NJJ4_RHOML|nr:hypothetical protein RHMOL_Rhmol05G0022800 [Rhododendron molle]